MFIYRLFFVFSFLIFLGCNKIENIEVDLANSLIIPKKYSVNYIDTKINIDGKDDESQWKKAPKTTDFIDISNNKKPLQKTYMKMLWDDENLYIYASFMRNIFGEI